jgi:rhodanese-related sulfurtransferase
MAHINKSSKSLGVMDKKVPKSSKYQHISGHLDTGLTSQKVKFVSVREFNRRRDEIYFRVNKDMLASLLREYESDREKLGPGHGSPGGGGGPMIVTHEETAKPHYDKPFLLIDCREEPAYERGRLSQARSFPHTFLLRDKLHPEMYQFRNRDESLIIVYCEDEQVSRNTCKILVDRGISNVFLLTGGMKEFAAKYGEFVEGDVPTESQSPTRKPTRNYHKSAGAGGIGYLDRRKEIDAIAERVAYGESKGDYTDDIRSISTTTGSHRPTPAVSDRVARALADRRKERDSLRSSPSRDQIQRRPSSYMPPATSRDFYDSSSNGGRGGNSGLSAAQLRDFDRQQREDEYSSMRSARGGGGGRSYDDRSESGFSSRTNKSVAESVISRAMSRKGNY